MKPTKPIFIALLLCLSSSMSLAQTVKHKTYDYVTIVATGAKPEMCNVSINGEKYEAIDLPTPKDWYNYNEVIKIVKKYEKDGYELFTSNMFTNEITPQIYFLLRKVHKE